MLASQKRELWVHGAPRVLHINGSISLDRKLEEQRTEHGEGLREHLPRSEPTVRGSLLTDVLSPTALTDAQETSEAAKARPEGQRGERSRRLMCPTKSACQMQLKQNRVLSCEPSIIMIEFMVIEMNLEWATRH